uniref:NAD-dependent epimerase/dehydratase family protein n=1 Tax=Ignavibacterium album TaxID=591197 RepID=A0A7V3E7P8_9BACT
MKKNILVTGAAGFIGSHLVEKLLTEGYFVTGIDNFDPFYSKEMKLRNLENAIANKNFKFIELDIRDNNKLKSGLRDSYDVIAHLAAKAGVRPSIIDPIGYQETNVYGTQNLLEFAKERNIKQFVYASSSSVYGINPNVPWKETECVLQPISPYASSKISGELLGHVYSHIFNIRFIGLRLFTVYGPRQRPDLAIHKFVKNGLEGKPIPFYGDGSTRRDYTYVDDIVNGLLAAMNYTSTNYEIINLGNHFSIALAELVDIIQVHIGKELSIERLPKQQGDVDQTYADINKAKSLLNWEPKTDIKTGIEKFVNWFTNK